MGLIFQPLRIFGIKGLSGKPPMLSDVQVNDIAFGAPSVCIDEKSGLYRPDIVSFLQRLAGGYLFSGASRSLLIPTSSTYIYLYGLPSSLHSIVCLLSNLTAKLILRCHIYPYLTQQLR